MDSIDILSAVNLDGDTSVPGYSIRGGFVIVDGKLFKIVKSIESSCVGCYFKEIGGRPVTRLHECFFDRGMVAEVVFGQH